MPAMKPLPCVRGISRSVPAILSSSLAPLPTLLTVRVRPLKVWPLSLVRALTPLNRSTALPFSMKLGLLALAARPGSVLVTGAVTPATLKLSKAYWSMLAMPLGAISILKPVMPVKLA